MRSGCMDKKRNVLKIPKRLWFWNKKTERRILRGEPFSEGVLLFCCGKGYFPDTG